MRLDLSDTTGRFTTQRFQQTILVTLAAPSQGTGWRILRLLRRPALLLIAAAAAGSEAGCLVVALLAHFHVLPPVPVTILGVCALLPFIVSYGWILLYPQHAYLVANAPALIRMAAQGDRRVVSPPESQPAPLSADEFLAVGSSIGPIWRAMAKVLELDGDLASIYLMFVGIYCLVITTVALVFAIMLLSVAPILLALAVLAVGLALGAGGIWLFRIGQRRRSNWRARISRPLQITVTGDGVSWEDGDTSFATLHTETLAWRQVEAFCTVEFQRDAWEGPYRIYLLWSGASQLAWEWTRRMPAGERAACDRLVRLAATQTRQPLYDLAPGVSTLAAALQETDSVNRPRADQALTRSLPPGLAAPLDELRRSTWRVLGLLLGSYALILLWGGLVITGSIFGLLAALLIIVALVVLWRRRRSAAA